MAESVSTSVSPVPVALTVHRQSRKLELGYDDGSAFFLPFEFLRVYSPSAEVQGHGPGEETLQTGKRQVEIEALEPVGHYGVQPYFSDGHRSGVFDWEYLHWLATNQDALWRAYLARLEQAGFTNESGRDAPMAVAGKARRCS